MGCKAVETAAAAAAKSLQSCLTLQPHGRQPTGLPCPQDSPGKNSGMGCHFLLQCMHACYFSSVRLCVTLWTAANQAPVSTGFSRQEYWNGLPFPSPAETASNINNEFGPGSANEHTLQ